MKDLWLEDLKKGFTREIAVLKMDRSPSGISLLPYMKVLDSQNYIDIMMKVGVANNIKMCLMYEYCLC